MYLFTRSCNVVCLWCDLRSFKSWESPAHSLPCLLDQCAAACAVYSTNLRHEDVSCQLIYQEAERGQTIGAPRRRRLMCLLLANFRLPSVRPDSRIRRRAEQSERSALTPIANPVRIDVVSREAKCERGEEACGSPTGGGGGYSLLSVVKPHALVYM